MIIPNGTIQVKRKKGDGGVNPDTGYAVRPSAAEWDTPIPCQYIAEKYNALALSDGEHVTAAEYTVLIDEQPFDGRQVRLADRGGTVLGEYSIIRVQPLEAVCEIKIWI